MQQVIPKLKNGFAILHWGRAAHEGQDGVGGLGSWSIRQKSGGWFAKGATRRYISDDSWTQSSLGAKCHPLATVSLGITDIAFVSTRPACKLLLDEGLLSSFAHFLT